MSTRNHDSQAQPRMQEEDLNDAAWNEVVATKLPAGLEEQARAHKAWSRKRGVSSVGMLYHTGYIVISQLFAPLTSVRTSHKFFNVLFWTRLCCKYRVTLKKWFTLSVALKKSGIDISSQDLGVTSPESVGYQAKKMLVA